MTIPERGGQPHLLFIAFFFPPSRASGVYRALAIAKAFTQRGWKVTVLTTTREFFVNEIGSIDESLVDEVPGEVSVIRIPFSFWKRPVADDIRSVGRLWGNYPALHRYLSVGVSRAAETLRRIVARKPAPAVTENYATWIDPVVTTATRLSDGDPFDHVLATGNPYSSYEAGRRIARSTQTPFSIDFRDPWSFDLYTGRPRALGLNTLAAERRIIEEASACFHVNEAIAAAYRKRYPNSANKHHVVENGYDSTSLPSMHQPPEKGSPLTFGMMGTITDAWPIEPVLEGWARCYPDLPKGSRLLLAGHLGYFPHRSNRLRETVSQDLTGFSYLGPVQKVDVPGFYEQLDVVIAPVPGGEMVTSGKIYEAIAMGIPVVCVQPRGGGARALLNGHPAAFEADPDGEQVAESIRHAAEAATTMSAEDIATIRERMRRHERLTAIQPMVEVVKNLTLPVS